MSAPSRPAASPMSCCCPTSQRSPSQRSGPTACPPPRARPIPGRCRRSPGPSWATRTVNIEPPPHRRRFPHRRRAGPQDHAGGGAPPVPLAPRFLHAGAAGRGRRGAAARQRKPHQIRHRRSLLGRRQSRKDVLARLRPARSRQRARLLGRPRQAQYLVRRLVRRGHGRGGQRACRHPGRLGAGASRQARRHRPLRGRRADERAPGRRGRCRDAGALSRRREGRLDLRADLSGRAGIPAFPSG